MCSRISSVPNCEETEYTPRRDERGPAALAAQLVGSDVVERACALCQGLQRQACLSDSNTRGAGLSRKDAVHKMAISQNTLITLDTLGRSPSYFVPRPVASHQAAPSEIGALSPDHPVLHGGVVAIPRGPWGGPEMKEYKSSVLPGMMSLPHEGRVT